jgi:programmed cell death protein 5
MSSPNPDESDIQDQPSEAEVNAQKEVIIKQILDSTARMRLNNIKMVKPDLAGMVENYLIGMASQGKIRSQINDDQFKQILLSIQQPKRDFKINRR